MNEASEEDNGLIVVGKKKIEPVFRFKKGRKEEKNCSVQAHKTSQTKRHQGQSPRWLPR